MDYGQELLHSYTGVKVELTCSRTRMPSAAMGFLDFASSASAEGSKL